MSKGKRIKRKDKESEKQLNVFLDRFNEEFEKLGVSSKAFAIKATISESSVSQYKNRNIKSLPNMQTIEKLAREFGVSSNYLLGKSDTPNYEHEDIMKKTGLSKKAYQILQSIKGTDLMNTINYLIEQEELELFNGFSPIYDGKEEFDEAFERALQSYEKELARVANNCVPILSEIHNYYSTKTTDEEMYIIDGKLKKLSDFKYKINRFLAKEKISTEDVIEKAFFLKIESNLKKSKKKIIKRKESKK